MRRINFALLFIFTFIQFSVYSIAQSHVFKKYPNNHFVESGSLIGKGIHQAMRAGYRNIYSIELSPYFFEKCKKKFRRCPHVKLFLGDSGKILKDVIKDIHEPITFWLDGHYSGGITAKGDSSTPILQELEAIKNHPIKTHTILIDDARHFGRYEFDYITLDQIKKKILEINPKYHFSYEDGYIANDILVAEVK